MPRHLYSRFLLALALLTPALTAFGAGVSPAQEADPAISPALDAPTAATGAVEAAEAAVRCNPTRQRPWPNGTYARLSRGVNCRQVLQDGIWREFIAFVPGRVAVSPNPAPVVFMFHGTSGNGPQYYNISRWPQVAKQEGLIAVFPTAARYQLEPGGPRTTRWNDHGHSCDMVEGQQLHSDVIFVDRMLRVLRAGEQVDNDRIHAAGFSSGGLMVQRLALDRSRTFGSVASWAGNLRGCPEVIPPVRPGVPVFFGVGSVDDRFVDPAVGIPPDAAAIDADNEIIIDRFIAAHALERDTWHEVDFDTWNGWEPPVPEWPTGTWTLMEWDTPLPGNETGNTYVFGVLQGVPHHYPNAFEGGPPARIEKSAWTTMAEVHWRFFEARPRP